jgi:predicted protein tyrosine phosphatase
MGDHDNDRWHFAPLGTLVRVSGRDRSCSFWRGALGGAGPDGGAGHVIEALLDGASRHPGGWPCRMTICGAAEVLHDALAWDCTHVVSIGRGDVSHGALIAEERLLSLGFGDVTDVARRDAPTTRHLEAAMAFVDRLPAAASLAILCPRGVSRAPALALGLLAREVPPLRAAFLLHELRPFACPNPLVVRLWDDLLGFGGELIEAAGHFPTVVWRHGDGVPGGPPARLAVSRHGAGGASRRRRASPP